MIKRITKWKFVDMANKKRNEKKAHGDRKRKSSSLIFTYSAIEQKRHNIAGPGKCLMIFLGIFPFVPLALNLYSCFVNKLGEAVYRKLLFISALVMVVLMLGRIFFWIKRIFYVYMIDEEGSLYRLRISNFWYRIKNQTYMLGPAENYSGRLMRMYYMIGNIKKVLEDISDTVTYDELIAMGRLERMDNISDVVIGKRTISFKAVLVNKNSITGAEKGEKTKENKRVVKKVHISRVYENDSRLVRYLKNENYDEPEKLSSIIDEMREADTPKRRMIKFTCTWTCLMIWAAVILLGSDFSRLARINNGEYVKTVIETENGDKEQIYMSVDDEADYFKVSDYGRLYQPLAVIYISVEIIYIISKCTDILIAAKKDKSDDKQKG